LSRARQLFFSVTVVVVFFGGVEIFLHLIHFHYQRNLSYMEFGYPNRVELHQVFELDPELLFRMKPGYDFGPGFGPLNHQGFRGADFKKEKPEAVLRVACLGDSVTFGTMEGAYPEMLDQILKLIQTGHAFQVYNFGVPGYSSWQGRRLLKEVIAQYRPDLVVIFYGWNDLWLAKGFSDDEQSARREVPITKLRDQLSKLRTYQLLNRAVAAAQTRVKKDQTEKFRVPFDKYQSNLAEMARLAKASGAKVIIATRPAGFGLMPLPDFFSYLGFTKDGEDLTGVHDRYNQAARRAAKENGAALLDLDLIFRERGVKNFFDRPDKDIIHPNRAGLELIAESAAQAIISSIEPKREKEGQE
jgi:lysophospholipase L1-like esterase